jgi:hypothetical protein
VLININKPIYLMIIIFMLSGCSTKAVIGNENDQIRAKAKTSRIFNTEPSDKELFEDALSFLNHQEKEQNYHEAKTRLQKLIGQYPNSNWATSAQALVGTLDRIFALQAALKKEKVKSQADHVKLVKEIDGLRDNIKQVEEKQSAETVKLKQENEQLKQDIQQLKNLEIQLERREKKLR